MDVSAQDIFQFTLQPSSLTKVPGRADGDPSPRRKLKSSNSSEISHKQSQKQTEQVNNNLNDELEKYILKALRGESMARCDITLFPLIISSLEDQRESYIKSNMYDEAQNAYRAIKHAKKAQEEANTRLFQNKLRQDLSKRKQEAMDELQALNDKTKKIEFNMILNFKTQVFNLEEKQQKEIEDFEAQWTSTSKQRMYNKTSAELQNLRRQEDLYLEQKLYKESNAAKRRADEIEKIEIQNAMEQMEYDYRIALIPIKAQHKQEMKTLLKAQEDEERVYKNAKKSEMDLILIRIKKIEKEYENLNDLAYVERIQLRSKSFNNQNNNNNNIIDESFCKSTKNSLSTRNQKEITTNDFNKIPVAPLNFAKQSKPSSSKRPLIKSPRSNSNRASQKH